MGGQRLLVVDDEPDVVRMLQGYFEMEGYDVVTARTGAEALEVAAGTPPDLVLLDVNMPGLDGFETCRRLRQVTSCPVVMLTARVEDADQLDGFAAGADDYVLKPFSLAVLGSRVRAHLAREQRAAGPDARARRVFGELSIDYAARRLEVRAGGEAREPELTRTEFDIVALLSKSPGRVFDRDLIYERVWGWEAEGDSSIVREHVRRARAKLAAAGLSRDPIETVWGVGYRWVG